MNAVHFAEADTPSFTFTAVGRSEDEARDAVLNAWTLHASETGADRDYLDADSIVVRELTFGLGYRDGQEVYRPGQVCDRCGSVLVAAAGTTGVCSDETCPYSEYPQSLDVDFIATAELTRPQVDAIIARVEGPDAPAAYRALAQDA